VVGGDIRSTSVELKTAFSQGVRDEGVDVYDIGLCGTEEIYFATFHAGYDGGVMVTASHNPIDYNGMKMVRAGARPISADSGLADIRATAEVLLQQVTSDKSQVTSESRGKYTRVSHFDDYLQHLLGYVDISTLAAYRLQLEARPLKVVVNAGNGTAGPVIDGLETLLPIEFIKVNHEPNGEFPNGIPNPMLTEQHHYTANAVKEHNADFGIAWDGDFDRCFFFDENGDFIEGYYIVGLLAEAFLTRHNESVIASEAKQSNELTASNLPLTAPRIIHDPRLTWNTISLCEENGGQAMQSKCGHSFIKEMMRAEDAVYGGEMSAHHYFRDFAYCDSGMIPWLLVSELLSRKGQSLSSVVKGRMASYPCSGEINRKIEDPKAALAQVEIEYTSHAQSIDKLDGISMDFGDWRFNLRMSNTEPVVRLNVETKANTQLMTEKTDELLSFINH